MASALNVNVGSIKRKYRLLEGICPEAEEMLKDRICPIRTFNALRKMSPLRQVEAVQLMMAADDYTASYAEALLASTPRDERIDVHVKKKPERKLSPSQFAQIEKEVTTLQNEVKAVEKAYARDQLNLVLVRAYIGSLINNEVVARFITSHYPDIAAQLEEVAASPRTPHL